MADEPQQVHRTWLHSDRPIPTRFVRPLLRFTGVEAAGGIVLLVAAVAALIWANAPFGESYFTFWDTEVLLEIGPFHLEETLKGIVNDGLMVIFFFVVGLEIKRELRVGELRDPRRAALPAIAALGGMVIPALIFIAFVAGDGGEATRGWGIPMATDIAFSIGILSLLGNRVPVSAKLFLLALAIADDIGAIAVIALFYTDDLKLLWLVAALAGIAITWASQRSGIRSVLFYVVVGTFVWFAVFESGVHATIAGVALGLLTPVRAYYNDEDYRRRSTWILERYDMDAAAPRREERIDASALELANVARESVSPLDRIEKALHPWSSFVIVPLFALANAGVRFVEFDAVAAATSSISLGVAFGLFFGKLVGITGATWLGVRLRLGHLAPGTPWRQIVGLALLAGVGFTVSLFITELAFTDQLLSDAAKIGIFLGSGAAGVAGYLVLRSLKTPQERLEEGRERLHLDPGGDLVDETAPAG